MSHHFVMIEHLGYTYAGRGTPTLKDISFQVSEGSVVLITGPTGCGKSTLMKCLCGIIPHETGGVMTGRVQIGPLTDTRHANLHEITKQVGLVFQNPDEQIFATMVRDEVAFGPENRGIPEDEVERMVADALTLVGLEDIMHNRTDELSGGQKQRVVVAGQLAVGHDILCLDEPFSQMDPRGAADLREALKHLVEFHHKTIILVEHRIHEVADFVDRVVLLENGEIAMDMATPEAFADLSPFRRLGLNVPQCAEIFEDLGLKERPLNAHDALRLLRTNKVLKISSPLSENEKRGKGPQREEKIGSQPKIRITDLTFQYDPAIPLFENLNLTIYPGERVSIMGPNGCGKTTLLLLVAGLLKPSGGRIRHDEEALKRKTVLGRMVGFLLQNPDLMLIRATVMEELKFSSGNSPVSHEELDKMVLKALRVMTISHLRNDYCFALSRGQRLRTAVASLLTPDPDVILLDEPTTGQDRNNISKMMEHFEGTGKTVAFSTHDLATTLHHATRLLVMKKGRIQYDGPPRAYFTPSVFDPQCGLLPNEVMHMTWDLGIESPVATVEDFVSLWGDL